MSNRWRALHFKTGYSAEFLPDGQRTWRYVKDSAGRPEVFPTRYDADRAARDAYYDYRDRSQIRATIPLDPARLKSKLEADAETWLKTKRDDAKAATTMRRPGKRTIVVMRGRA